MLWWSVLCLTSCLFLYVSTLPCTCHVVSLWHPLPVLSLISWAHMLFLCSSRLFVVNSDRFFTFWQAFTHICWRFCYLRSLLFCFLFGALSVFRLFHWAADSMAERPTCLLESSLPSLFHHNGYSETGCFFVCPFSVFWYSAHLSFPSHAYTCRSRTYHVVHVYRRLSLTLWHLFAHYPCHSSLGS